MNSEDAHLVFALAEGRRGARDIITAREVSGSFTIEFPSPDQMVIPYPPEELFAARTRRATQLRGHILTRNHGSYEKAMEAHYLRGEPHPDDANLPLNLWDETA